MWLRDGLPHDLKGARVLVYGYNTNLLESQTFQNVDDIAIAFSKSIRSIRMHNKVSGWMRFLGHWKLIQTERSYPTAFGLHFPQSRRSYSEKGKKYSPISKNMRSY
jgi:hypothetical protein